MPLTSLYLLSLNPSSSISSFTTDVVTSLPPKEQPILIARPLRWIIDPWIDEPTSANDRKALTALTSTQWDILLIFPSVVALQSPISDQINNKYSLSVGISAKVIENFRKINAHLLHPQPGTVPPLTGSLDDANANTSSTSKDLHLTSEIQQWFSTSSAPKTAPSMLNFLTFKSGMKESYQAYGRSFGTDVGKRRGGLAKIVGTVPHDVKGDSANHGEMVAQQQVWDEIAVAHYPTVWHFADMVMGKDYQEVNDKHRVGALRGTAILCCDELDREILEGIGAANATKSKI